MTISRDRAEKLWAAAVNPSSSTVRDVDHIFFYIPEPERYWRSSRPTELTLLQARERDEDKFNDELNRIEKEMQELRKFYLEHAAYYMAPESVDALLGAGYAVAKEPPPKQQNE
ncbi:hypothetical protein R1sor_005928 [Riccia sorocarpa]|uniref:Uncharacterized protein n=1 Tax=Riccia sorocarpa TaxID=122646 RepID=A0ABD3HPH6_9MARC